MTIYLSILTMALLCIAGGYHTFVSAAVSILLIVYLLAGLLWTGQLKLRLSLLTLAILVFCLMHFLICFWAVDPSMTLKGGIKFLPVFLLWLFLAQIRPQDKEAWLELFPGYGAAAALLSYVLSLLPGTRDLVVVEGRLGGTFQYPNTFAVFLLSCSVIAACRVFRIYTAPAGSWDQEAPDVSLKKAGPLQFAVSLAEIALCMAGIALSGSRTVYLLTFAAAAAGVLLLILRSRRDRTAPDGRKTKVHRQVFLAAAGVLAVLILVVAFTGAGSLVAERVKAISMRSSTLLGRILYAKDALPILMDRPGGLGFYGYRFLQGMYQTGNYAVVNTHNELLQLFLDTGLFPGLLFLAGGIWSFFREEYKARDRFVILLLFAHALMDYDFHFLGIWLLFLLLLPSDGTRIIRLRKKRRTAEKGKQDGGVLLLPAVLTAVCICLAACPLVYACLRIGISDYYYVTGRNTASQNWYPNTVTALNLLAEDWHTGEERRELADLILAQDAYVSAAYAVKAQQSLEEGNVVEMAVYQKAAIRTNPYRFGLYTDYLDMLYQSAKIYLDNGDRKSAHACGALAAEIPGLLEKVEERTSDLGWNLSMKPTVRLDDNYQKILDELIEY